MDHKDFDLFHADLGYAMKVIKHQEDNADQIIRETNHYRIDKGTALFLNSAINLDLEFEEKVTLHS